MRPAAVSSTGGASPRARRSPARDPTGASCGRRRGRRWGPRRRRSCAARRRRRARRSRRRPRARAPVRPRATRARTARRRARRRRAPRPRRRTRSRSCRARGGRRGGRRARQRRRAHRASVRGCRRCRPGPARAGPRGREPPRRLALEKERPTSDGYTPTAVAGQARGGPWCIFALNRRWVCGPSRWRTGVPWRPTVRRASAVASRCSSRSDRRRRSRTAGWASRASARCSAARRARCRAR